VEKLKKRGNEGKKGGEEFWRKIKTKGRNGPRKRKKVLKKLRDVELNSAMGGGEREGLLRSRKRERQKKHEGREGKKT